MEDKENSDNAAHTPTDSNPRKTTVIKNNAKILTNYQSRRHSKHESGKHPGKLKPA